MQETVLIPTGKFNAKPSPDQAAIRKAVTLWLTKELNKPHQ